MPRLARQSGRDGVLFTSLRCVVLLRAVERPLERRRLAVASSEDQLSALSAALTNRADGRSATASCLHLLAHTLAQDFSGKAAA